MNTRFLHLPWSPTAPSLLAGLILGAPVALAQNSQDVETEQLTVVGVRVYPVVDTLAPDTAEAVDTAELLRELPGANLNANGTLTGIAQYRGLYGDRVAVTIDGLGMLSGGPNAMDAPLSYASPLLLENLHLERGIASVSSAVESIGGHIGVAYDRGSFGDQSAFGVSGKAQMRYADNGNLTMTAAQLVGASDTHKVALLGQIDRSDDLDFAGGTIRPSRLKRDRYDLSYGYNRDDTEFTVFAGRLETDNTGTASLPMDIRLIETDIAGVRLTTDAGGAGLDFELSRFDVDHVMDNYSLRTAPASAMSFRANHAVGDGYQWRLGSRIETASADWRIGVDGETAEHTATITNPNVAPFRVENFNAAERDVMGLYAQWNGQHERLDFEAGLRVNRVSTNSGTVGASIPAMNPTMQMMAMNAALLADAFNNSVRDRSQTNVDAVFKVGRVLGEMRSVYVEFGRKTRAPSYQELFLWLPLEATGGLADGRSYIGNPALDSEVSLEINIGSNWYRGSAWFTPQIFFKEISDYIQGNPTTNATANMVALMMTGMPALEFANTDAEIYGFDLAWGYYLSESLVIDGVLTYSRGKRTDIDDNLYRLAPLNGRIGLTWESSDWSATLEAIAYSAQNRVAAYNAETPSAGYGIVNASMRWQPGGPWALSAGVANLLDKRYQDHLDGINRVAAMDVPLGERLVGLGRSVQLGVSVSW
jgi:iron complex outermembrane receptor protein